MDKKRTNILFIVMAVTAIVIIIGTGAYAYYRSTMSGTISGTIAKWDFKANNQTETFKLEIGELYPGKTLNYNIELSAEDSDLDVYYEVYFQQIGLVHTSDKPNDGTSSHHIYFDSAYTNKVTYCGRRGLYGVIPAGEKINIPIYYNWPYDENSNESFSDGTRFESATIRIVGQQYTAYTDTIPMKLLYPNFNYADGYIYTTCDT